MSAHSSLIIARVDLLSATRTKRAVWVVNTHNWSVRSEFCYRVVARILAEPVTAYVAAPVVLKTEFASTPRLFASR